MSPQSRKLKIAIIGCGNMARVHARLLLKHVHGSQLAVCDRDEVRLNDFAESFLITQKFNDLKKMLDQFKPDLVHVVTPPRTHKDIAVECLKAKCHVLIEKPMCLDSHEAGVIARAAEESGRMVCVDHMRVFDPAFLKLKSKLHSKEFGTITNVHVAYSYDYLKRINTDPAARWINLLPGGSFFDLMPHVLCLIDDLIPGAAVLDSVIIRNENGLITDLHCIFAFQNQTATLHMSLNVSPLKNYVEVECTNGVLRVDFRNFLTLIRKNFGLPNAIERIVENISLGFQMIGGSIKSVFMFLTGDLDPYSGLNNIIRAFIAAIKKGDPSPVPAEDARRLLELTEQIFKKENCSTESAVMEGENQLLESDVLVTGATGFIGRHLVNRLLGEGKKVRIFSHQSFSPEGLSRMFIGDVNYIHGNIYNLKDVEHACSGVKTVYHLAAAMQGDWTYHLDTTVTGTRNILKAAQGARVERFVYASTINVYDAANYPEDGTINESFTYEPMPQKRGAYSHAKLKAEKLVKEEIGKAGMKICLIRPGLVYGPGDKGFPRDVAFRFGKKIAVVMGMGLRKIPFVYVGNLVDAFIKAGEDHSLIDGRIYNVIDPEYPDQREYLNIYRDLSGEKFFAIYVPFMLIYAGFWFLEGTLKVLMKKEVALTYKLRCVSRNPRHSTSQIQTDLSWRPQVNFRQGLALALGAEEHTSKGVSK